MNIQRIKRKKNNKKDKKYVPIKCSACSFY